VEHSDNALLLVAQGHTLPAIRRVEYDVDRELKALTGCGLPHAEWVAKILDSASPQMP